MPDILGLRDPGTSTPFLALISQFGASTLQI
jgi:hypothetical protein